MWRPEPADLVAAMRPPEPPPETAAFVVDVEGFEGPLDLLLTLARSQKVDLAKISILALAEQYLAFVETIRRTRLELAADYLVMAAWLAYLKSRLLLPEPPADTDEPTAEELAADLALRLRRLEAIRRLARHLDARPQLDRDVFARGRPEGIGDTVHARYEGSLYELLTAYAAQRQRTALTSVRVSRRAVWSLAEARQALERLIGRTVEWTPLNAFLERYVVDDMRATMIASTFSATLELAREGVIELRQSRAFGPLLIRTPAEPIDDAEFA